MTRNDDKKSYARLRPEARPLPGTVLHSRQLEALTRIVASLEEAVGDVGDKAFEPFGPGLDPGRKSRLLFLSGDRGSGKTTLFLSLRYAFHDPDAWAGQDAPADVQEIRDRVARLQRRIIWLSTLDMEPLARPTNLLAAIIVRIRQALAKLRATGSSTSPVGHRSHQTGERREQEALALLRDYYHGSFQELHLLERDVALAWDGNIRERAGRLDPDNYAAEVIRAEEARLGLNRQLRVVLDELAGKLFPTRSIEANPLFVLPVDDFDLNPTRVLELLRLLRMIAVPQLFTLVLGDRNIVPVVLRAKHAGDLSAIVRTAGKQDILKPYASDITSVIGQVSAHALRKLLPPGQVVQLAPFTVHEALKTFVPTPARKTELPTFRQLMERFTVEDRNAPGEGRFSTKDLEPKDLLEFLTARIHWEFWVTKQRSSEQSDPYAKKGEPLPYQGAEVLADHPRPLCDLWLRLRQLQPGPGLRDLIGQLVREAIEEDPVISSEERGLLNRAIVRTADGWNLDSTWIQGSYSCGGGLASSERPGFRVRYRRHRAWSFRAKEVDSSKPDQPTRRAVAPRTAAWLLLFHDLCTLSDPPAIFGADLTPTFGTGWARTHWQLAHEGLSWAQPVAVSFWELDLFTEAWEKGCRRIQEAAVSVPARFTALGVYLWQMAWGSMLDGRKIPWPRTPQEKQDTWYAEKLADRADQVRTLVMGSSPQTTHLWSHWFVGLACNLAPEIAYGAEKFCHAMWQKAKNLLSDQFTVQAAMIRSLRARYHVNLEQNVSSGLARCLIRPYSLTELCAQVDATLEHSVLDVPALNDVRLEKTLRSLKNSHVVGQDTTKRQEKLVQKFQEDLSRVAQEVQLQAHRRDVRSSAGFEQFWNKTQSLLERLQACAPWLQQWRVAVCSPINTFSKSDLCPTDEEIARAGKKKAGEGRAAGAALRALLEQRQTELEHSNRSQTADLNSRSEQADDRLEERPE